MPACRTDVPVPAVNDGTGTLTGTVTLPTAAPGSATLSAPGTATPATGVTPAGRAVVMAVESGPSGSGGNYAATPLNPAGTWSVQDGTFDYTYPISVPQAVTGSAPSVALGYDSQSVDGETSAANTQGGWIGDGWSSAQGYITRTYKSCGQDTKADTATATDECWGGYNGTLTLGSHSGRLVLDGGTGTTYHVQGDDGTTVQLLTGASNGLWDGEYWLVTTTDGTKYYFGQDHLPGGSGSDAATSSARGMPVYCPASGDPCYSSSDGNDSEATLGWQWNLDYVVSPQGALTEYTYKAESNYYTRGGSSGTLTSYTRGGFLTSVQYGWLLADALKGAGPQAEVKFTSEPRCTTDALPAPGTRGAACTEPDASSSATAYPDVPLDEICGSSGTCANISPTFFSTDMLTGIAAYATTGTSSPALQEVDSWQVGQQFDTGTGTGVQTVLALTFIQQTGQDASAAGSAVTVPAQVFGSEMIDSQVPGSAYPPLDRPRLESVTTEAGGSISIDYAPTNGNPVNASSPATCAQDDAGNATMTVTNSDGTQTTTPISQSSDTAPCFEQYWQGTGINPDWFVKSLVTSVVSTDLTGTRTPDQVTSYTYRGGAAWHLDEDPLESNKYRTWSQFRGYAQVAVSTGEAPDPVTETVETYMRGMDQDPTSTDGTSPASVTVSYPSAGPDAGNPAVTDSDWLAGQVLESDTYTQYGGTVDKAVITSWPTAYTQTASQPQTDTQPDPNTGLPITITMPALTAHMPTSQESDTRDLTVTPGTTTTSWNDNSVATYYDSSDRKVASDHSATGSPETCTSTTYAAAPSDNAMMLSYQDEVTTVTGAYSGGSCPAKSTGDIVSDAEYFYDSPGTSLSSLGTLGTLADAVPAGIQTAVRKATRLTSSGETWQPASLVESLDGYNRVLKELNGNDDLTTTAYTPAYTTGATGALPLTVAVTNAKGWITTTTFDQERANPVEISDVNSEVTTETYDQLGRLTSVTLPGDQGLAATYEYSYYVTGTAPPAVTTQTLQESGYSTNVVIYNGLLQEVQTRSTPQGNQSGSVDTYTEYNSDAWVTESDAAYYNNGSGPSSTLVVPIAGSLTNRVLITHDGQARPTATATYSGTTLVAQATTAYPGLNETDTTPPQGGTATTVITNALGQKTQSWSYDNSATPDGKPADADITIWTYTPAGQVASTADNAGNTWQYGYDLLGEKTSATDPGTTGTAGPNGNEGQSTYTYDDDGNNKTVTDPLGNTLTYDYDSLDRKTEADSTLKGSSTATKIASWSYDTAPLAGSSGSSSVAHGQLAQSDSFYGSADYSEAITGYDAAYTPTGQTTTIPAVGSLPKESFTTSSVYSSLTDQLQSTTYGNDGGSFGLPKETVGFQYNPEGLLTGYGSSSDYLDTTSYNATGQIQSATFGASGSQMLQQYTMDQTYPTRLDYSSTSLQPDSGPVDMRSWTYNAVGDVTSSLDQYFNGTTTATNDLQCYSYDDLQQLQSDWTDTGPQTPTPPTISSGTTTTGTLTPGNIGSCANSTPAAANIGGIAPYWDGYSYDPLGSRTNETTHDVASTANDTTANETSQAQIYSGSNGTAAAAQPAAATSMTTTSPGGSVTVTPTYDADGNTVTRTVTTTSPLTSAIVPSSGSLCLDDASSKTTAGNKIDISTCNGTSAQKWTVAPLTSPNPTGTGSAFLQVLGNCASVSGSATASGTVIVLEPCSSATKGEIWVAGANGTWVNPNSGLCLTDPGGTTTTGTQVTITACNSSSRTEIWATAAGTSATPLPGSTQGITYYPTGRAATVKQSSGTSTQTITYIYDADGNLLVQEDPSSVIYYGDGGAEELVLTTAGTVSSALRFYGQSPDGTLVARAVTSITSTSSTSNVYFEVADPHHTGLVAINASTLATSRRYYDPYGNQVASSGSWPDNKAYLNKVRDAPTGLDLLGARQYNAVAGAFLSLDPVLESGSPQQMGGYTYAGNDPVTGSDPSGLLLPADGGGGSSGSSGSSGGASCAGMEGQTLACGLTLPGSGGSSGGGGNNSLVQISPHVSVSPGDPQLVLLRTAWSWVTTEFGQPANAAAEAGDWGRICWNSPPDVAGACSGDIAAYFRDPTPSTSLQALWGRGGQTLLGSGGVFAGVILPNRYFSQFKQEQANMERAGIEPNPVSPGDPGWDAVIGSNDDIKWAVLQDGSLVVMPKFVDGIEVPHSFLSGGEGVQVAGEAQIASMPGMSPYGIKITDYSGHFHLDPPGDVMSRLQIGVDAFAAADITFAEVEPFDG